MSKIKDLGSSPINKTKSANKIVSTTTIHNGPLQLILNWIVLIIVSSQTF